MFGSIVCIVILSNCLMYETRSLFTISPYEYMLAKRQIKLERRYDLQGFCARRCNIGRGGNVCRCNGYHFAGKRTSISPTPEVTPEKLNDEESNEFVYKILQKNNDIALNPEFSRNNGMVEQREDVLRQIMEILPHIVNGDYDTR